jgi:hypothetical protein
VAGDIVTVKEGVFRLVGDKPGPDGPGDPH